MEWCQGTGQERQIRPTVLSRLLPESPGKRSGQICTRVQNLSFTHHREVAALTPIEQRRRLPPVPLDDAPLLELSVLASLRGALGGQTCERAVTSPQRSLGASFWLVAGGSCPGMREGLEERGLLAAPPERQSEKRLSDNCFHSSEKQTNGRPQHALLPLPYGLYGDSRGKCFTGCPAYRWVGR